MCFFLSMAEAHCQNNHRIICTVNVCAVPVPADSYRVPPIPSLAGGGRLFLSFFHSIQCQQKLSNPHTFNLPYNFHTSFSLNYTVFHSFMHLLQLLYQLSTTLANRILNTVKSLNASLVLLMIFYNKHISKVKSNFSTRNDIN